VADGDIPASGEDTRPFAGRRDDRGNALTDELATQWRRMITVTA
jgi:hypothetical protein